MDRAVVSGAIQRVMEADASGDRGEAGLPYMSRFSSRPLVARAPTSAIAINPELFYDPLATKTDSRAAEAMRTDLELKPKDSSSLDALRYNKGPLSKIQGLLLRSANDPLRAPPPNNYSPERHGSVSEFPPADALVASPPNVASKKVRKAVRAARERLGKSFVFSNDDEEDDDEDEVEEDEAEEKRRDKKPINMPRGAKYDPAKEVGVAALQRSAPKPLRPTDAMRRFTLFRIRHDSPGKKKRKELRNTMKQEVEAEADRAALDEGVATNRIKGGGSSSGTPSSLQALPLKGKGDPYPALKQVSEARALAATAEKPPSPKEEPTPRSRPESTGLDAGMLGVSRANRMGSAQDAPGARNRRGTGMVRGVLTVAYGSMRLVSAEARRWGSIENVQYSNETAQLHIVLMPQFYDSFVYAMRNLTKDQFHFAAELKPPLFVAEVGRLQSLISKRDQRIADGRNPSAETTPTSSARPSPRPADHLQKIDQQHDSSSERRPPSAASRPGTTDSRLSAHERRLKETLGVASELDIARYHVFNAQEEIQELVNRYFRTLAREDDMGHVRMEKLMKDGVPTIPDGARRESDKLKPEYPRMRIEMLLEAESLGAIEPKWAASMETGVLPRVYPGINAADEAGMTALHEAAKAGHTAVVKALLRWGADRRRKTMRGQTALDLARARSNSATLALAMRATGAAERRKEGAELVRLLDDRSVLVTAQHGDTRRLRYLIEDLQEEPNLTNRYGMTALHFATMNRDVDMVQTLVNNGGNVHAKNNVGQTPLTIIDNIELEGDPDLAKAMRNVIEEGEKIWKRESHRRDVREKQRVAVDRRLTEAGPALRRLTAGTSAARAVFSAFPPENPTKTAPSSTRFTQPAVNAVAGIGGDTVRGLQAATRKRARGSRAVESWSRHAVSYLSQTARLDHRDHQNSSASRLVSDAQTAIEQGPDQLVQTVRNEHRRDPTPVDHRFDAWLSARFGMGLDVHRN